MLPSSVGMRFSCAHEIKEKSRATAEIANELDTHNNLDFLQGHNMRFVLCMPYMYLICTLYGEYYE